MKRRKTALEILLWLYLAISLFCLILCFVPAVNSMRVFQAWLFCTRVWCLGLAACICVLLVRIMRFQKKRKQVKKLEV